MRNVAQPAQQASDEILLQSFFSLLESQGESYMLTNKRITLVKGEPKSLDIILASLKTDFTFYSLSSRRVALYLLPQVTAFPYYC